MLILINTNYVFKNAMSPTVLLWGLICGLKTLRPLRLCVKFLFNIFNKTIFVSPVNNS